MHALFPTLMESLTGSLWTADQRPKLLLAVRSGMENPIWSLASICSQWFIAGTWSLDSTERPYILQKCDWNRKSCLSGCNSPIQDHARELSVRSRNVLLLWKNKFQHHVSKQSFRACTEPVNIFTMQLSDIHFNIIIQSTGRLPTWHFLPRIFNQTLILISCFPTVC
jgi:hypothetical protein